MIGEKIIPMTYDIVFKKVWGDPEGIKRLTLLLSICLGIPYEELLGNIEIIESEKRNRRKKEKIQKNDIVVKVKLSYNSKINIELNARIGNGILDRNVSYISHIFSSQIENREDYKKIEPVIQINFNKEEIDKKSREIIDKYYIQNSNNHKLTEKFQIWCINIEKCYEIWYNKKEEEYSEYERAIIKLGSLIRVDNIEEFKEVLGGISMNEELKSEIEETVEDLNMDDAIFSHFGSEKDMMAMNNSLISEAKEEGIEEGKIEGKIEIVKNMLAKNIDINTISEITEMSKEEIEKLK